jgi:catechol O-methyltransferase
MDDFAAQHDFLINIGPDKVRAVTALLAEEKPRILVELGGYVGYSAIFFAAQMRQYGAEVRVWSLEFDPTFAKIAEEFIEIAGLSDVVTVVTGAADASLRELKSEGKLDRIDLLFLDHVEDLYEQDLKVAEELELLKPNSIVLADNVVKPGAPKYRNYVRSQARYTSWGIKALIVPGDLEASKISASQYSVLMLMFPRMSLKLLRFWDNSMVLSEMSSALRVNIVLQEDAFRHWVG